MARPRSDIDTRVLRAAAQRFLRDGVDGASLREIARDAGTSVGMVTYYFPTKDDLFTAVVEGVYVGVLRDISAALAPDAPLEEKVQRLHARASCNPRPTKGPLPIQQVLGVHLEPAYFDSSHLAESLRTRNPCLLLNT